MEASWMIIPLTLLIATLVKYRLDRLRYRYQIKRRKQRGKYVYFYMNPASCLPSVKIGRAKHATERLKNQKTPLPFGVKVLGVVMVKNDVVAERLIHNKFALQRIHDDKRNEWFWLTPSVIWYILTVRDMKLTRKVRHEVSN